MFRYKFAACTCPQYRLHNAHSQTDGYKYICCDMYITCNHIFTNVIVSIKFLQNVPAPNTGHIMHTARWADINICPDMYNTCSHII